MAVMILIVEAEFVPRWRPFEPRQRHSCDEPGSGLRSLPLTSPTLQNPNDVARTAPSAAQAAPLDLNSAIIPFRDCRRAESSVSAGNNDSRRLREQWTHARRLLLSSILRGLPVSFCADRTARERSGQQAGLKDSAANQTFRHQLIRFSRDEAGK